MKKIAVLIIALINSAIYAQGPTIDPGCPVYEQNDLTLTINGWDFDRTDYDHGTFANVVGATNLASLSYSGEKDTEEFGYPWFYYADGVANSIQFKGLLEGINNSYQGKKIIHSFIIRSRNNFNVNGLRVGDLKSDVTSTFSNVCYKENGNLIYLYYKWYTIGFLIDPATNTILEIELYSPI
jgi:hypothetical protein